MADYKIELGIGLNSGDFADIKKKIESLESDPIKLKVDAETKELTNTIKEALNSLSKGTKNVLTLDTSKIEASLKDVADEIRIIKSSIGTLDGGDMKSLLTTINQMNTALDKASNQFVELNRSLDALSRKDFSLDIGIKLGGSNSVANNSLYGDFVKDDVLPTLKKQEQALTRYLARYFNTNEFSAVDKLLSKSGSGLGGVGGVIEIMDRLESPLKKGESLKDKMREYKNFINSIISSANMQGVDLSPVLSQFEKLPNELIETADNIRNGTKQVDDSIDKLKHVFGGSGIDAAGLSASLEPIITDLGEIRKAAQDLSKGISLDGLTASFDRLSDSIEKLVQNATKVKNVLGDGLGNIVNKSAKQSLNLDDVVDEQVLKLMNEYAIAGGKGSKAFDEIRQSLVDFRNGSGDINKVTSAISNNMKVVNEAKNDYKDLADYIRMFNASGAKVHIPDSIKQEYGDDYKSMRSQLGKGFTSGQGMDFETFAVELNSILGDTIDLSHGAEAAFGDLVRKVNSTKGGKFLTGDDLFGSGILDMGDVVANVSTSLEQIENAEEEIARASTSVSNTVVQNEERKQQAYKETANAYAKISKDTSLVRDDADFQKTFEASNRAAQEAQRHFQELLTDEKAVVSVVEQFDNTNALQSFVVNVKRASGEVETLRYAMDKLDDEENGRFRYQSGSATDRNVEKQLETRIKKANDLQIKLDKIKSGYEDMGAAKPIKDFGHIESLDEQYEKVKRAIIDVRNADDSTFLSMISNAEKERAALENMVREFRNAETVATSLRSKDISTVKDTYSSKLDVLISKMRKDGVYTSGFENGAENLRSVLSDATDSSGFVRFLNGLDKLEAGYKRASASAKEFNQTQKVGINVSGLESKIADLQRISPEIDRFETEIDGAKVTVQSLLNDLKQVKTQGDFSVVNSRFKAFTDAAKATGIAVTEVVEKVRSVRDIKLDIELGNYDNQISQMDDKFNRLSDASKELRESVEQVHKAYKRMEDALEGTGDEVADKERLIQAEKEYARALEKTDNLIRIQARTDKVNNDRLKLDDDINVFQSKIDAWLTKNSAATKQFGSAMLDLKAKAEGVDRVTLNHLEKEFKQLDNAAEKAGLKGLSTLDRIKGKFKEYMGYFSVAEVFMWVEQGMREMFNTVKEIDTAMTGLYRVTDLTASEYDTLFNNMIDSAKEYGATLNDIINATTDWVRAGFDANTSLGLAEVTTMYQHISDLDYDTAAENLITAYNGFKDELNGAFSGDQVAAVNYIADIFNELDNNFAITSAGLGEALTRSASALDLAGNTIQQTAGMVTGITEVTQDPEKAGSALKVLSLRLRGMKGQLEELGEETDENVENISKMQGQILNMTGGKVNIFDGAGNFKSTYEIMKGIAEVWDDLSSIDQADLLETIAGKHRANDVAALLSNWENVEAAVKSATEAEGSAARENAKYVDSIQGRLDKLTTVWQSFANTFMSSDFLKGAISGLTKVVELLEWIIDNFGLIGTISAGVIGKNIFSYFKGAKEAKASLNDVVDAIHGLNNAASEGAEAVTNMASANTEMAETATNVTSATTEVAEATANTASVMTEGAEATTNMASAATEGAEALSNTTSAASEAAETITNVTSASSESTEAFANMASTATEVNEALANTVSAGTEAAETIGNLASGASEFVEAAGNTASAATEGAETVANLGSAAVTAGASAGKAAGGFKAFFSTLGGKIAVAAAVIGVISLIINQVKKAKEEASKLRQETIQASDEFLDSASSFEQAYIKYSGKTNLTVEEEEELESAIKSTVDALGDKSSALKNAVNNSNDYVASLERIADAELEAAERAAKDKKIAAEQELKDVAIGWTSIDGNEVDITGLGAKVASIAKKMNSEFVKGGEQSVGWGNRKTEFATADLRLPTDADANDIVRYYDFLVKFKNELSDAELTDSVAYTQVTKIIDKLSESVEAYTSGIYDAAKAQYQLSNGIPKTTEEYLEMREAILRSDDIKGMSLDAKSSIANTLDSEYKQIFDLSSAEVQAKRFIGLIKGYGNGAKDGTNEIGTVETFLNMRTAVNNNECSVGEYLSQFDEINKMTENWSDEEKELLNTSLGLDTDTIKQQYAEMQDYLKRQRDLHISPDNYVSLTDMRRDVERANLNIDYFLDSLTADELAAVIDIRTEIDWANTSAEDIRKQIEDQVKLNEALSFEANIEADTTALETLNEILTESASAMGLSSDAIDSLTKKYSSLDSFDPSTLFEATGNGVKVNREELEKLEKEYNDLTKTKVKEHLDTLVDKYNDVTAEIDKCTNAGERAELLAERETYADKIEELATYQAQLEGVTGAYQDWINAQNTPEDYEGYEAVATGREDIESEIDRGFIGNSTKKYIDLLSGEDLDGKSVDDYAEAWEKLDKKVTGAGYSVNDFFTVNDDGDITSTGIDRFFKSLQTDFEGSVAKFDDKTKKWTYDFGSENLEKIKEKWGIGIEAIELLLEAAASAGYDIDWDGILDGIDFDTSNFETLVSTAEAAQTAFNKLEGVEDVDFNFTATGVEEATSELEKARSTYIDLITNKDGTINLNAKGAAEMRVILATLLIQKQQLEDSNIAINIDTSGLDESQQDIANAINAVKNFREKYKNLEIAVTTGQGIEEAKTELNTAMTELQGLGDAGVDIAAELILGEGATAESLNSKVDAAISAVGSKDIKVGCKLDETAIGTLNSQVLANFTPEATVKITGIDDSLVSEYTATEKTANGKVKWDNDTSLVVEFQSKTQKAKGIVDWANNVEKVKTKFSAAGTVKWTSGNNVKVKVISEANGTANANGTTGNFGRAFKHGDWGIKGSGTALVGELGMETLVRGGHFYTIGDTGAEFIKYQQGDIIFNHKQTEELFKNGKVTSDGGRGRMFANGSAFAEGNYSSSGRAYWQASASSSNFVKNRLQQVIADGDKAKSRDASTKTQTKTKNNSVTTEVKTTWGANASESNFSKNRSESSTNKDKDKEKKEFEEVFDWIETAISRIEREIDNLDRTANSVYKSWGKRNEALAEQISKVGEEIKLQNDAAQKYLDKAGEFLDHNSDYAKKIQNGALDFDTLNQDNSSEETIEKIKNYQKWYELYLDCTDAAEELKETEAELYAQRFENVQSEYENLLQGFDHTETMLNEYISQAEAKGHIVSKKYYDSLIDNEEDRINTLKQEQSALIKARDEAVANDEFDKYSEEWYNMCTEIDSVTQAIEEGTTSLIEYSNSIRDIEWEVFDLIQERISDITAEADFLIELMSNKDLFDDNGKFTSQGVATAGLHAQNYNTYMYQADEYGKEAAEIDKQLAKAYSKELEERRRELIELQREAILNAEGEKNAIRDLVEEGINLELEALDEKIQKYEDALDSQKD